MWVPILDSFPGVYEGVGFGVVFFLFVVLGIEDAGLFLFEDGCD